MSLKYRPIIPTIFVFAVTFGMGTLLGVYGARRPAESQLRSRLRGAATALAGSGAPVQVVLFADEQAAALGMRRSRLRRKLRAYGLIQRAENSSNP